MFKYIKNNVNHIVKNTSFRCHDCSSRFHTYEALRKHVLLVHKNLIPDEDTVDKYIYDRRNPTARRLCVICKINAVEWEQSRLKYNRFCSEKCRKQAREIFRTNMKKKYNKDTLLNDPEHQAKMLANRSISGEYTFSSDPSLPISYTGKYELDFLQFIDKELGLGPMDIIASPMEYVFYYYYEKKKSFYIPDFYMPELNLLIEIKDSSEYPIESKVKSKLKDIAVINAKKCNYIKIVDKKYEDFLDLVKTLRLQKSSETPSNEFFYIIPK